MKNSHSFVYAFTFALGLLGAGAAECAAQPMPPVRDIRAHLANWTARSSRPIRKIVLHTSEGSEQSCVNTFRNPSSRVSAHYLVSKAGRITRFVPDMSIAYHAKQYNFDSIGIENEGRAAQNGWTAAQYDALAKLVRALCTRYGIPKDRKHIIGHHEVPGSHKSDPGKYFDWKRFISLVRGGGGGWAPEPSAPSTGLAAVLTTAAPMPTGRRVVEVTASHLNVRATPGGTILGIVRAGSTFVTDAKVPGWTRISWRGRSAWIGTQHTRAASGTIDVVRVSALNVRAAPTISGARVGMLARGQAYRRLDRRGVWILIQFDQRQAWVHSAYTVSSSIP
jgi:N-acetylmuramoyl-L-alanine amidase CwlA